MSKINYEGRKFVAVTNSASGESSAKTVFYYHQNNDLVWAEYEGGEIVFGNLIAKVDPQNNLEMCYQHINQKGDLRTGRCTSTPEIQADGRIKMHEKWQWTSGDFSRGESVIEEIK